MTWKQGYAGERIELLRPQDTPINHVTICAALAQINRFGGHLRVPYNVALHSIHVSRLLEETHGAIGAQVGLLHDAHEAYVGDVATPIKHVLGQTWTEFERGWETRVRTHFGLAQAFDDLSDALRQADLVALQTERHGFMRCALEHRWPIDDAVPPVAPDGAWLHSVQGFHEATGLDYREIGGAFFMRRGARLGLWPEAAAADSLPLARIDELGEGWAW